MCNGSYVERPASTSGNCGFMKECIKADKVFDWIRTSTEDQKQILVPEDCRPLIRAAILAEKAITATCTSDPRFTRTEILRVDRKWVWIDTPQGKKRVRVGCAQILKTPVLKIQVFADTFPICNFLRSVQLLEKVALCFPENFVENDIKIKVTNVECMALPPFDDDIISVDVLVCQDIQVEKEVKLEILANFCFPREDDIVCDAAVGGLSCEEFVPPEQCPDIFPR